MSDQRSLQGRIAAHTSWANTPDRAARTAPARAAMLAKFETQVDPEGVMAPAERVRRAESARTAYFLALAVKSADTRRRKAAARTLRAGAAADLALADQLESAGGDAA